MEKGKEENIIQSQDNNNNHPKFRVQSSHQLDKNIEVNLSDENKQSSSGPLRRRRRTSLIILQESEDFEKDLRERSGRKFTPNDDLFQPEEVIEDTIPIDDFYVIENDSNDTKDDSRTPSQLLLRQAASFVNDANTGRYELHKIDEHSLKLYSLYHKVLFRWTILFCVVVQTFILPLFETPRTFDFIPEYLCVFFELLILIYFIFIIVFKYSFLLTFNENYLLFANERKSASKDKTFNFFINSQKTNKILTIIYLIIIIIFLIDIFQYFFFYYFHGTGIHFSRILRPFFIIYFIKPIQLSIYTILKMLPTLLEISFVILCFIFCWSTMCYLLFLGTDEGSFYLGSIGNSFISFYTLMTTANYPDVMMPAYSLNPWTCLFFVIFLLITTYLLKNLILAYVFKTYSELMKEQYKEITLFERQRLYFAYTLLDPHETGGISYDTWEKFIAVLRPAFSKGKAAFMFRIINSSNSGRITIDEFLKILKLLEMKIYKKKKVNNEFALYFPRFYEAFFGRALRVVIYSQEYEYFMLVVVILNVIRIMVLFVNGRECVLLSSKLEIIFYSIFIIEIFVKLFALGIQKYFMSFWNILDLMIILATFLLNIILIFHLGDEVGCRGEFTKILYFAPALRLLRILTLSGFFKEILKTISLILPALFTYISLQLIMFYFWVIIGMEIWGGQIYRGNPDLEGTAFDALDYYQNSFNNFVFAYVTCFELLVVNNWQFVASGYVAISGGAAWIFFVSFNLWAVLIIMNWVIASIIESYGAFSDISQYDERSFKRAVNKLNRRWSRNYNSFWYAKDKKKFKISLGIIYGGEETEEYVKSVLGSHKEAERNSREVLYRMKAYLMNDTNIKITAPDESTPLLLKK